MLHSATRINLLLWHMTTQHVTRMIRAVDDIEPAVIATLLDYDHPGNIRELENIIKRGIALARQGQLSTTNLPTNLVNRTVQLKRQDSGNLPTLIEREADSIQFVLDRSAQNRTRAAKIPGIDRTSLWRKLKNYGMDEEK